VPDSHRICSLVNAANSTLLGGGGVDYAIHKAAGGDLYDACRRIAVIGTSADRCRVGEAAWTIPGRLRVKGVVHTVGPMYSYQSHDKSAELLTKAYRTSLALASEHGASTIAFPAISCGAYGYPHESAAEEAVAAIAGACAGFDSVHIILYDGRYFGVWEAAMRRLQPHASSAPAMVVAAAPPKDISYGADTLRAAAADRCRKRLPPGR
jgi:O-acetyl-ADP-ribose deacetylase (regulator of RNase III)